MPLWLLYNNDFISLQITQYLITPCTNPGYLGVVLRSTVSYCTRGLVKNDSFIIKIKPFLNGTENGLLPSIPLFENEGRMYSSILPEMRDLLKNNQLSDIIAPDLIHFGQNPDILILQDLSVEKFYMQCMPIPSEKATIAAKKLGKFHGLSYYMAGERSDDVVQSFKNGLFTERSCKELHFVEVRHGVLCELAREWGLEAVAEKLVALKPHLMKKLVEIFQPNNKGFGVNVLNHGDFHIKNMLLSCDDQQQDNDRIFKDIRFVSKIDIWNVKFMYVYVNAFFNPIDRLTFKWVSTQRQPLIYRISCTWLRIRMTKKKVATSSWKHIMMNLYQHWLVSVILGDLLHFWIFNWNY